MYGTTARMKVKPGKEDEFLALAHNEENLHIPGFVGQFVYRLDRDLNEFVLVVVFADDDSYFRNADSPEQDARYHQMRELLAEDPEWFDGELVHAWVKEGVLFGRPDESEPEWSESEEWAEGEWVEAPMVEAEIA